jgi:hypothetical protein
MSKRFIGLLVAALALVGVFGGFQGATASAGGHVVLKFDKMVGVPRPYTDRVNAIRGIPGGGLPWVIGEARGELKQSGELKVEVEGLVFDPNDQAVIDRGIGGTNTVPNFKAIVSCLSKDAAGNAVSMKVETGLFPADAAGNAEIEAKVDLPRPCIAPIIFVASPGGAWFAATGL